MSIISIYNHAFFWTLEHLEPEASLTSCRACKMIRHIQVSPAFLKVEKVPWFWREKKDCVHLLVIFYIQEHLRKKPCKVFPCGAFFFLEKQMKNFWMCACTQALFFFQNVYRGNFSVICTVDLMLCTASDTFRILANSELCLFRYIQTYSALLRH